MESHSFIVNVVIFLGAAVALVPLFSRLGLGSVLGYLTAGVLIGPYTFGLISNVEDILHFSEFGVVLLLFIIGLELEPKKLWGMRASILGSGGLQTGLTALLIGGLCMLLGLSMQASIAIGLSLALSSTAIALQTLQEKNLMETPAGKTGFSILLFQDIAVIPIIALIPLLGVPHAQTDLGHGTEATHMSSWVIIPMFIGIFIIGRYALRYVFIFVAATRLREIFTALSLLLVCGIATLMDTIGLSMALGAFLAGVLLADSEYRHTLESDIEPFKGLLLGLFFISVGMSINFELFFAQPVLLVGLTLLLIMIKGIVLWLIAKTSKLPASQTPFFTALLSQGGEFAFVLLGFALAAGVLTDTVSSQVILVVALSMAATPLLLVINDRFIAPRFCNAQQRPMDEISPEDKKNKILIAGYGRFGQVIGRLLIANKIQPTVIDHNPDQIELVRKFGTKAYFGDVLRHHVLDSAGAATSDIIVLAMNDQKTITRAVIDIKKEYPNLVILARAIDRLHALELVDLGVKFITRETFYSALKMGCEVLETVGYDESTAKRMTDAMRKHDLETLYKQVEIRGDEQALISMTHDSKEQLEKTLEADKKANQGLS